MFANETNTLTISSLCARCLVYTTKLLSAFLQEADNEISRESLSVNAIHGVYAPSSRHWIIFHWLDPTQKRQRIPQRRKLHKMFTLPRNSIQNMNNYNVPKIRRGGIGLMDVFHYWNQNRIGWILKQRGLFSGTFQREPSRYIVSKNHECVFGEAREN